MCKHCGSAFKRQDRMLVHINRAITSELQETAMSVHRRAVVTAHEQHDKVGREAASSIAADRSVIQSNITSSEVQ